MKKLYIITMITVFICSLGAVNNAYLEMMGKEDGIVPTIRKTSENTVEISVLDRSAWLDTSGITTGMNEVRFRSAKIAKSLEVQIARLFGKEENNEPTREAYGIEIL